MMIKELLEKDNKVRDAILGIIVGDALGVPFEFSSADQMKVNPCKDMVGYGTHNQPPGTWSDDSSLTLCLTDSLLNGLDYKDIAKKFILWKKTALWTAHNQVFDIGMTTSKAISMLELQLTNGTLKEYLITKYMSEEDTNGNGSLMRIMPLLFYLKGKPIQEQFNIIWDVSALTHGHIRAAMCCMIYLKYAEFLMYGHDKIKAYLDTRNIIEQLWQKIDFNKYEQGHFQNIIQSDIRYLTYDELKSGGYVMETLETSLWCLLHSTNYSNAVLRAINKGHDTDTSAAVTGGLAGLYYGTSSIPEYWISSIARLEDILNLVKKFNNTLK